MCDTCDDTGYVTHTEWHPYGSTYAGEQLSEPCPDCLEKGICPKCGEEPIGWIRTHPYWDIAYCARCSWKEEI